MAAVSHLPSITQRATLIRLNDIGGPDIMAARSEIVPEPIPVAQTEDKIYVAVGKEFKECRMTLIWALRNSGGKKICFLYVLVPAQKIPMGDMGIELAVSAVNAERVREYREVERHNMHKLLDEYLNICSQVGVQAEKLFIEKNSIEKGILELIGLHGIRKLVMGAASDRLNARKMVEPKSKKALYVRDEAPVSCHIWFICNGLLIYTREGTAEADAQASSSPMEISSIPDPRPSKISRSESAPLRRIEPIKLTNPVQDIFYRVFSSSSDRRGGRLLVREESFHDWDGVSRGSTSQGSAVSSSSSGPKVDLLPPSITNGVNGHRSPPSVLDQSTDNNLYDQYEQALTEADYSRLRAHEEAIRRGKAEKQLLETLRRIKTLEILLTEEKRQRKDTEEALSREEHELQKLKNQRDEVGDELRLALDQKSELETQISESEHTVWEYERKIISAVELLQSLRQERDNLQIERDGALREAEELRKRQGEMSSTSLLLYFSEISFSEIVEATQNFNMSLKIGEGGYGSIYKGYLRHTQVAIKMLNPQSRQGPSEFQQEVDVLSKVRHPNLVTLIGACPDAWSLVYEYLPNGSLEDRLCCKDNTTPLPWQTRVRVAAELCSALIFLHSCKPHSVVHGDVKPANVLLDAHFVTKLGDFGICRVLNSDASTTLLHRTDPKGTFAYMDPEFLSTGELTPKSDVYSFGIVLLRLLTGKDAIGISKEVREALDEGNLEAVLDPLAGDWPFVQAEQLAHLALRCCDPTRKNRPDLGSEVWRMLESMKAFCGGSKTSFQMDPTERRQPPSYFVCPILHEIMQDPQVAADGFTYESEALRGWLESGHDTSPMTNLPLAHTNLIPNRALRSAIQEWLQNLNI